MWEREEVYRIYVTDALYSLVDGANNNSKRYIEIVEDHTQYFDDPEEAAKSIIDSIRGKLKNE